MHIEFSMLILSVLFFTAIIASKAGSRLGVPALLLFLAVGMLFGSDGLGVHFDNIQIAQIIGTAALCAILFSGGLDTKIADIRPVLGPGVILATLGVVVTAIVTALIIHLLLGRHIGIGLLGCLLLASTMSSTDSASVFSILRGKGLRLKHNLRPTLELESGANDPMAYVLTVTFISLMLQGGEAHYVQAIGLLLVQLTVGVLAGFVLGEAMVWFVNKIRIDNAALHPVLMLSGCFFVFAATHYLKGNSYLAVYIAGLVVGNRRFVHKRSTRNFFEGVSWIAQLGIFLTLGLLVNPSELRTVLVPGVIISMVMIFISRPLSVFLSLLPFPRYTLNDRMFLSWVGLRGAVPVIFAILCRASNVPHGEVMFNIVFVCTLSSLVLQGTTLPLIARWLGVSERPERTVRRDNENFDIDFPEEIHSATYEIAITPVMLRGGSRLMDLRLPRQTLAIMVKRGDNYFVPTGTTLLHAGDKLMALTDNLNELCNTLNRLDPGNNPMGGAVNPSSSFPERNRPTLKSRLSGWLKLLFDDDAE
ncbi:MAG: cell volume regulation protein A [bacterium P3]|nr:MAG: cell volume regulation protein A [bacterium P3]KWW42465.1 MAG: cell volume regulation protein A [bacterium F083]